LTRREISQVNCGGLEGRPVPATNFAGGPDGHATLIDHNLGDFSAVSPTKNISGINGRSSAGPCDLGTRTDYGSSADFRIGGLTPPQISNRHISRWDFQRAAIPQHRALERRRNLALPFFEVLLTESLNGIVFARAHRLRWQNDILDQLRVPG
jgi:hypothetical protein